MIRAAGIMILTARDGRALFLRRADTGMWAFPGGVIEAAETAEQAAERELLEEAGPVPHGNPQPWMRRIASDGPEEVDYSTFIAKANDETIPALNDEHTAWMWASVNEPPEPLHPGARVALSKLTMDELGIARAMAAGDLTSPQKYGTFWLWAIRITGTGVAYRDAHDEYCYRPQELYLNEEFLARCNGLPVVFKHPPKKPKLDGEEYNKRNVGSVFLPYLKGDEVWAIVKIYDDATADILLAQDFSTSPGVVFGANSGNYTLKTKEGADLLIEGKPALLDHIALEPLGVWDKGGPPAGVQTDVLIEEPVGMSDEKKTEAEEARKDEYGEMLRSLKDSLARAHARLDAADEKERKAEEKAEEDRKDRARMDAARKDKFGHRKDGETKKEWDARHDADEMAMCDALMKGGVAEDRAKKDAKDCRMDAEERERKDGGESFEKWAKEEAKEPEHKDARKDGEDKPVETHKEEDREDSRKDAATVTAMQDQITALQAQIKVLTTETPPDERNRIAEAQSRADSMYGLFGQRASAPLPGESSLAYRRRVLGPLKQHSAKFKEKDLNTVPADLLDFVEETVYHDAETASRAPGRAAAGMLIPIERKDEAGRTIRTFTGDNLAWMLPFMSQGSVGRINRDAGRL